MTILITKSDKKSKALNALDEEPSIEKYRHWVDEAEKMIDAFNGADRNGLVYVECPLCKKMKNVIDGMRRLYGGIPHSSL